MDRIAVGRQEEAPEGGVAGHGRPVVDGAVQVPDVKTARAYYYRPFISTFISSFFQLMCAQTAPTNRHAVLGDVAYRSVFSAAAYS